MGHIFISYAHVDREYAARLRSLLVGLGFDVWLDDRIEAGSHYDDVIEDALDQAEKVLVIWTAASVKSQWVRAEAGEGLKRGTLIPISADGTKVPLEFRRIQTIDFSGWRGEEAELPFGALKRALAGPAPRSSDALESSPHVGSGHAEVFTSGAPRNPMDRRHRMTSMIAAMVATLVAVGLAFYLLRTGPPLSGSQQVDHYLSSLPCSWLRVANHSSTEGRQSLEIEGASLTPASLIEGSVAREAMRQGIAVGKIRAVVAPIHEKQCSFIDKLKQFRYSGVPRIDYEVVNEVLGSDSAFANKPGTIATLALDHLGLKNHFALLGIESDGDVSKVADKRELLLADMKAGDDILQLQVHSDEAGWQGLILVESDKPIDLSTATRASSSPSSFDAFDERARESGWRFELIWYYADPSKAKAKAKHHGAPVG